MSYILLVLLVPAVSAFFEQRSDLSRVSRQRFGMIRNIDLPEAVILYGRDVLCDPDIQDTSRRGLTKLLQECFEVNTAVIVMLEEPEVSVARKFCEEKLVLTESEVNLCHVYCTTLPPPNPTDLLQAVEQVQVQERAFGGSAGFGRKAADPSWRNPLFARCVVWTSTIEQTRAARACGMRTVSVDRNDPLADAVVYGDEIDFDLDSIATPGSFWLNPPQCRDDEGNTVDPYQILEALTYQAGGEIFDSELTVSSLSKNESDWKVILNDLAPL